VFTFKLPGASVVRIAPAMLTTTRVPVKASDLNSILEPWYHEGK
jgi:hypothetical protein